MLSALAWVPRGAAAAKPIIAEPTAEELEAARRELLAREGGRSDDDEDDEGSADSDGGGGGGDSQDEDMADAGAASARARAAASALRPSGKGSKKGGSSSGVPTDAIEAGLRELDMDNYDNDDDGGGAGFMSRLLGGRGEEALDEDGDPYITLPDSEDGDSDDDELVIKPDDLLILAARTEDDVSNLEVWVYEEADAAGAANVYVHHDVLLPAFPLCVAWMDCAPGGGTERANVAAVGSMEPGIELWDIDVMDSVEPAATLGGEDRTATAAAAADGASAAGKKKKKVRA
eukprot:111758-Chlamydomonas_euryale.AAC.11